MLPTMQGLVEDMLYVFQSGILMSVGDSVYQCSFVWRLILPHNLINQ